MRKNFKVCFFMLVLVILQGCNYDPSETKAQYRNRVREKELEAKRIETFENNFVGDTLTSMTILDESAMVMVFNGGDTLYLSCMGMRGAYLYFNGASYYELLRP